MSRGAAVAVGAGVLALAALFVLGGGAAGGSDASAGGAGWTASDGVQLNATQRAFVDRVAARVGGAFPVHVTSGIRDPLRQARAMLAKVEAGDDLLALYQRKDLVRELLATERTAAAWAAVIAAQVARGDGLSRHLRGDAVDFRTKNLTPSQVAALDAAVRAEGARSVVEDIPPHLHAEDLS